MLYNFFTTNANAGEIYWICAIAFCFIAMMIVSAVVNFVCDLMEGRWVRKSGK